MVCFSDDVKRKLRQDKRSPNVQFGPTLIGGPSLESEKKYTDLPKNGGNADI